MTRNVHTFHVCTTLTPPYSIDNLFLGSRDTEQWSDGGCHVPRGLCAGCSSWCCDVTAGSGVCTVLLLCVHTSQQGPVFSQGGLFLSIKCSIITAASVFCAKEVWHENVIISTSLFLFFVTVQCFLLSLLNPPPRITQNVRRNEQKKSWEIIVSSSTWVFKGRKYVWGPY